MASFFFASRAATLSIFATVGSVTGARLLQNPPSAETSGSYRWLICVPLRARPPRIPRRATAAWGMLDGNRRRGGSCTAPQPRLVSGVRLQNQISDPVLRGGIEDRPD